MKSISLIAAVAATGPAMAQFSYQSQDRFVEAMGRDFQFNEFNDRKDAVGFLSFNEQALVAIEPTAGEANQNSTLDAFEIRATGDASGIGINGFSGSGRSYFEVRFSLDAPADYQYFASTGPGFGSLPSVRFSGPSGVISFVDSINSGSDMQSGTLPAGAYTIIADAEAAGAGIPDSGTYRLTLSIVPAPASAAVLGVGGLAAVRRRR